MPTGAVGLQYPIFKTCFDAQSRHDLTSDEMMASLVGFFVSMSGGGSLLGIAFMLILMAYGGTSVRIR
jgi:hypothetical protein